LETIGITDHGITVTARIYQLPRIGDTAPMTRIARIVVSGLPHYVT